MEKKLLTEESLERLGFKCIKNNSKIKING